MSDFLNNISNITLNTSNGSLHLSDLHVTDDSGRANTTLATLLTNSTNTFTISFESITAQPLDNLNISGISENSQHELNMSADSIDLQNDSQSTHNVTGTISTINGDIPFTATLNGANDSMSIGELNNSFSNSSFTRETDNESNSNLSFLATDESTGGKKKRSTKKRKGKKKRTTKKRKGKKKKKTMRKQRKGSKKRIKQYGRGCTQSCMMYDDYPDYYSTSSTSSTSTTPSIIDLMDFRPPDRQYRHEDTFDEIARQNREIASQNARNNIGNNMGNNMGNITRPLTPRNLPINNPYITPGGSKSKKKNKSKKKQKK